MMKGQSVLLGELAKDALAWKLQLRAFHAFEFSGEVDMPGSVDEGSDG